MAGSIALSLTQRYDKTSHDPLDGGLLYFYAAGTLTPQNAFQDVSLTLPWPNPLTLDSGGNVPQLFFEDGYVKFRLSNAAGVTQIEADFVLVLGPTSGGGAAPSVDATTILATGDIKTRYGTGVLTGFVRANGRTIGSATSGATERANSDTQSLFEYLWGADANLSVSSGRGASANADWVANKNIALPDWRGRVIGGLDDMGNSAAGRLTAGYLGTATTALGAAGGSQSHTMTEAEMPIHDHELPDVNVVPNVAGGSQPYLLQGNTNGGATDAAVFFGNSGNVLNAGAGTAFTIVQPTMLATIYIKL